VPGRTFQVSSTSNDGRLLAGARRPSRLDQQFPSLNPAPW
jgi:hypothetical protein